MSGTITKRRGQVDQEGGAGWFSILANRNNLSVDMNGRLAALRPARVSHYEISGESRLVLLLHSAVARKGPPPPLHQSTRAIHEVARKMAGKS